MKRREQRKSLIKKMHILFASLLLTGICLSTIALHLWRHEPAEPQTLSELLNLPEVKLARVDIARMNLLCATGLPNSENIRLNDHLQTLDRWAEVVKKAEEKYLPTFYRNPAKHENSLPKFKAITLVLTPKEDLKCGYNMELVRSGAMQDWKSTRFFKDSRDLFLHGLIEQQKGTCASLPLWSTHWDDGADIRFIWSPAKGIYFADGKIKGKHLTSKRPYGVWIFSLTPII